MNYYNSNDEKKKKFSIYFVTLTFIFCRRCKTIFSSNNKLHNHVRFDCRQKRKSIFDRNSLANDVDSIRNFLTIEFIYSTKIFFIVVIKVTFISSKFSIINFDVNVFKNLDIEYDFRDWIYIKSKIFFTKKNASNDVYFDIKTKIILTNSNFFRKQNFNTSIKQMIISLTIRELDITQYQSFDYVIVFIYFANTKKKIFVTTLIRKKMHLMKNLKINILIDIDVIISKNIVIDLIKKNFLFKIVISQYFLKYDLVSITFNNVSFMLKKSLRYRRAINWSYLFIILSTICQIIAIFCSNSRIRILFCTLM